MGFILRQLEEDATQDLWGKWLGEYWSLRNQGIPLPPDPEELENMIDWIPNLAPVFSEAVERIGESPLSTINHSRHLYRRLEQSSYVSRYPEAVATLLHRLLPHATEPFLNCAQVADMFPELVRSADAPRSVLYRICDELARLGCENATELRGLIT
jgi:hypothetical protein